ncbi:MAG: DNA cytosine methyltransferase, partial [Fusobacteriales bacterium]|nr:DNA cytosine methyltransferase [Fusobacteriales bacterium]
MKKITCIDVFAGGGGLSEGFHRAGYNIISHIEKDTNAALTLKTRLSYQYLQENNTTDLYIKYLKKEISRDEFYSFIPSEILDKVINEEISENTIADIFSKIDCQLQGEKVDIIIGGPPCQAYSLINRPRDKNGTNGDERKYLYKQYLKFIDRYKPKIFVFENVLGMLSSKDTDGHLIFEKIKKEMTDIGYNIGYKILNSSDFGVLQERKRIILIGWKKDIEFIYPNFEVYNSP